MLSVVRQCSFVKPPSLYIAFFEQVSEIHRMWFCYGCTRATVDPKAQILAAAANPSSGGTRSLEPPLRQLGGLLDCILHMLTRQSIAAAPLPLASLLAASARILAADLDNAAAFGEPATFSALLQCYFATGLC